MNPVQARLRADLARLEQALASAQNIVVSTHLHPDGDAIGSESLLVSFLHSRGKQVRIVNNDPTPELLKFIEPQEFPVEIYDADRHDAVFREADLILVVDNAAPDRLGGPERIICEQVDKVLCIDHHPDRHAPWKDPILDVTAAATAVIVYRLVKAAGWTPGLEAARAAYVGVATDTGFFRFNSANAEAYRTAAELIDLGVDTAQCFRALHERNSVAFTRLLGHALEGLKVHADGVLAEVSLRREVIVGLEAQNEDTAEITSALLAIDGVRMVLLFRELGGNEIKVSLRSKGSLDVHCVATRFGGGGHRNASGIVMPGTLDSARQDVLTAAQAYLDEIRVADKSGS